MQHFVRYPHLKLILMSVLCSLSAIVGAQEAQLFNVYSGRLNTEQQQLINTLESSQTTKRTRVATIPEGVFNNSKLTANLFEDQNMTFQASDIGTSGVSARTWTGVSPEYLGSAAVVIHGKRISAHISSVDGSFEIIPLDDQGTHLIIEHDLAKYGNCGNDENIPRIENNNESTNPVIQIEKERPQRTSESSECRIRLLVAYTPDAQTNTLSTYNRTMIEHVELAILQMNQGYANSLADQRVELAYLYKTTDVETGNSTNDINDLRDTSDGKWDEIHDLRNQYDADMVALITDGSYSDMCGRAYGFDYELEENMFQITEYNCAVANFSLAHEYGHLQGCRHNVDANETPFAFGHGYNQGGVYQTIMAVCCGGSRVNYWSNPYVYYPSQGMMGTLNFNYNTKALNISDSTVAHHRINPSSIDSYNMIGDDYLVHRNSTGVITTADTTISGGCLTLQSEVKVRLAAGFRSYNGSHGNYRIATGCTNPAPLTTDVEDLAPQRDSPPKTFNQGPDESLSTRPLIRERARDQRQLSTNKPGAIKEQLEKH